VNAADVVVKAISATVLHVHPKIKSAPSASYPTHKYSTLLQLINKFQTPTSAALHLPLFLSPTLSHPINNKT